MSATLRSRSEAGPTSVDTELTAVADAGNRSRMTIELAD
jgi:hypothetical protein